MSSISKKEETESDVLSKRCEYFSWRALANCSSSKARSFFSFDVAKKEKILPLSVVESVGGVKILTVASDVPSNIFDIKRLEFISGVKIVSEVVNSSILNKALYVAYGASKEDYLKIKNKANISVLSSKSLVKTSKDSKAPVPTLLDSLIKRAYFLNSSDLHIEPSQDVYRIRFRVNGELEEDRDLELEKKIGEEVIRRIKILCDFDSDKKNFCREGSFTFKERDFLSIRIRVSILFGLGGETVVLRLLDNSFLDDLVSKTKEDILTSLGLNKYQKSLIYAVLGKGAGSILTVGPTGSGKSTLLYALISLVNDGKKKILTIEDPVERVIDGALQMSVSVENNASYSELLKAGLRQDPDIIMVGEIRDLATSITALTAGMSGHLLFSSIHASNAIETFSRLKSMGVLVSDICSSVKMIIRPILLKSLCPFCKEPFSKREEFSSFFNLSNYENIFISKGCVKCENRKTSGLLSVFEIFFVTEEIQKSLMRGGTNKELKELQRLQYKSLKLKSMDEQILSLVEEGKISPYAALKGLGVSSEFLGI